MNESYFYHIVDQVGVNFVGVFAEKDKTICERAIRRTFGGDQMRFKAMFLIGPTERAGFIANYAIKEDITCP